MFGHLVFTKVAVPSSRALRAVALIYIYIYIWAGGKANSFSVSVSVGTVGRYSVLSCALRQNVMAVASPSFAKRGRPVSSCHFTLTDENAKDFLDSHCNTSGGPSALWPYSKGKAEDWKKTVIWAETKKSVEGKRECFGKLEQTCQVNQNKRRKTRT